MKDLKKIRFSLQCITVLTSVFLSCKLGFLVAMAIFLQASLTGMILILMFEES